MFCRRNAKDGEDTGLTARELSHLQSHFVKTVLVMLYVHIHHPALVFLPQHAIRRVNAQLCGVLRGTWVGRTLRFLAYPSLSAKMLSVLNCKKVRAARERGEFFWLMGITSGMLRRSLYLSLSHTLSHTLSL